MKALVFFSGGKDSQASLIWAVKRYGVLMYRNIYLKLKGELAVMAVRE
jgi:7-cyano-7-deazaguanine synthase in queuosine biosynthesis